MICPNCGQHFSVSETRNDYQFYYGLEHPFSEVPYDSMPQRFCLECAKEYALQINPMTICRECGKYFNLDDVRYNFGLKYSDVSYDQEFFENYLCEDCAEKHMDAIYSGNDDGEYEDIY